MSTAKIFSPKKAVCKHEGCFESPSTRGYCRLHFLSVLKGRSEGDQKPRANLKAVAEDIPRRKARTIGLVDDLGSVDEAFASNAAERLGELDLDIDSELEGELPTEGWKRFRKAG
jgi:hypothetical protein